MRPLTLLLVMGTTVLSACAAVFATGVPSAGAPPAAPSPAAALPRMYLDTTVHPLQGKTIVLKAGDDLQKALNAAQSGDIITLEAGATFTGPFTLPRKNGDAWIVVRSSAPDEKLPAEGTRIAPAYASALPKIVSPGRNAPAMKTAPGAHHFRFIGVEFAQAHDGALLNTLVVLGDAYNTDPTQTPHHLVLDRVYIHGLPDSNVKHCVELQTASTSIINSHISDCKAVGYDAQALVGWNGPGPFKIVNNYLEGAGENIMFGGGASKSPNLVPSDIEIRRNHFNKPLSWKTDDPSYAGTHWSVKNLFELKNAQRVLVDGNTFEHNWPDAQAGFAIQLTPRNEDGTAPWSVVQDVTFTNNIVRQSAQGMNILGTDTNHPSQRARRILVRNNLFEDIGHVRWGGGGKLFQIMNGAEGVVIEHNTAFHTGPLLVAEGAPNHGFVFSDNITAVNLYGITGSGAGVGTASLERFFPGYRFENNVIVGPWPSAGGAATAMFPIGSFFPMSLEEVSFVNRAGGDYRLAATSPYKHAGTDGRDIGADLDAVATATVGVGTGHSRKG